MSHVILLEVLKRVVFLDDSQVFFTSSPLVFLSLHDEFESLEHLVDSWTEVLILKLVLVRVKVELVATRKDIS